jgi:hypothetical protein
MVYAASWTAGRVLERLELAFRAAQGRGVWSPRRNELLPAIGDGPVDGLALIAASAIYLGRQAQDRVWLLTRASSLAYGRSIRETSRSQGWTRSEFYRRTNAAAATVAARLNERAAAQHLQIGPLIVQPGRQGSERGAHGANEAEAITRAIRSHGSP